MPLHVQNRIQVQMHPWMLVETTHVTEFEYYFACTCKGIHLAALPLQQCTRCRATLICLFIYLCSSCGCI